MTELGQNIKYQILNSIVLFYCAVKLYFIVWYILY